MNVYRKLTVVCIKNPYSESEKNFKWFLDTFGMVPGDFDPNDVGILWTERSEDDPSVMSILIDSREAVSLVESARSIAYDVVYEDEIDEPTRFGDDSGYVEILRHRHGWVIIKD